MHDGVPPELDIFSFDFYSGPLVDQKGKLKNASSPYYCPAVTGEAVCVANFLKQLVYPKLQEHQRVMVHTPP